MSEGGHGDFGSVGGRISVGRWCRFHCHSHRYYAVIVPIQPAQDHAVQPHDSDRPRWRSTRIALVGATAAAPLLAGALIPADLAAEGPQTCLTRSLLGVPCPFCGATRAFVAFGHGDPAWFHSYNGFWVLVSIAALLLAVILVTTSVLGPRSRQSIDDRLAGIFGARVALPLMLALLVIPGWIWALTNQSTIV